MTGEWVQVGRLLKESLIVAKRLERGTFTFPQRVTSDATSVEVDVYELLGAKGRNNEGVSSLFTMP